MFWPIPSPSQDNVIFVKLLMKATISIFSFSPPPQCACSDSKTVFRLLKHSKNPLLHPKLEKSKKHLFKDRRSGQIDFFLFFDPPKCACSDSKTVFGFWKNPKKIQKRPLLYKNYFISQKEQSNHFFPFICSPLQMWLLWFQNSFWILKNPKKSKNTLLKMSFKGRKSGKIDFFLFFDPPKCACSDSKTVFGFWKNKKKQNMKNQKDPFYTKNWQTKWSNWFFSFSLTLLNVLVLIQKKFSDFEKIQKDPFFTKNWKNSKNIF